MSLILLGYIDPESTLPLASALVAVVGVALIGWKYFAIACTRSLRMLRRLWQ